MKPKEKQACDLLKDSFVPIEEKLCPLFHFLRIKIKTKHAELLSDSQISGTYERDNYCMYWQLYVTR